MAYAPIPSWTSQAQCPPSAYGRAPPAACYLRLNVSPASIKGCARPDLPGLCFHIKRQTFLRRSDRPRSQQRACPQSAQNWCERKNAKQGRVTGGYTVLDNKCSIASQEPSRRRGCVSRDHPPAPVQTLRQLVGWLRQMSHQHLELPVSGTTSHSQQKSLTATDLE